MISATSYGAINTCRFVWEVHDYVISLYGCLWTCSDSDTSQISCGYSVRGWLSYGTVDLKLNWYISMTRYGYGVRDWLSYVTMDVHQLVLIVTAQIKSFRIYCFGWQVMAFELFRPSFDYGACGWLWNYGCTFSGYSINVYMSYWLWHGAAVSSHLRTLNQQVWFDGLWEIDLRERDRESSNKTKTKNEPVFFPLTPASIFIHWINNEIQTVTVVSVWQSPLFVWVVSPRQSSYLLQAPYTVEAETIENLFTFRINKSDLGDSNILI